MLAAIAINAWKKDIFEKHLTEASFPFTLHGKATSENSTLVFKVPYTAETFSRLHEVVLAANIAADQAGIYPKEPFNGPT